MAMTLRLSELDEARLRELAHHDHRNLTDEIAALIQERHATFVAERDRAYMRSALREQFELIEQEDAAALDLLSR
jgi:hypothetical protein